MRGFYVAFYLGHKDLLFAKQLIYSLENCGIKCFPNFNTVWHFDDKVGQKYLLEAIEAPIVHSYVFYNKNDALSWINEVSFPKVFKLRGGAGSSNVKLVKTRRKAKSLIKKAFRKGFMSVDYHYLLKDTINKYFHRKARLYDVAKYVYLLLRERFISPSARQKGYIYFQDFIPNNTYDIRVVVVGNRAFALKRMVRKGDFRASGSGEIEYDKQQIDERCVNIAFSVNKKLNSQSVAFNFVFDNDNNPLIVEISYGYTASAYDYCEGFWTDDLQWHEGSHFDFCGWMVENVLATMN